MFEDRPGRDAEVVLTGRSNVGKSTIMREVTGHAFETGGAPGVTRAPNFYDWTGPEFLLTDLPGFGFMEGVEDGRREAIKTDIVRYLEANADAILAGIVVVDGKAVVDIVDRHREAGEVPHVIDLYSMFEDIGVVPIVAVNKMDKVDDRDARLDAVADRFGLPEPWQQWRDRIAPITAKRGDIEALRAALRMRFEDAKREDLLGYVV